MYFRNYGVQNTCLDKCLKGSVLEHPLRVNMLKGPKHCLSLHDSIFITSFHYSEEN